MNKVQFWLRGVLPLVVMAGGVVGAVGLIKTRPQPEKKDISERGLLVEVQPVAPGDHPVTVRAQGTVVEAFEVDLAAEIGGRVIWKNPELTEGGQLRKGDPLLKIDPRDYKLAIAQERAAVAKAEADLELELGRKRVAEQEWKHFGQADAGPSSLATREPQLRSAKLGLDTARSGLGQAQLKLDRTIVRAPFNAIVRNNQAERGRLVSPQQALAQLVDSDTFMVVVSLPVEDLRWLKVPGVNTPLLDDDFIETLVEKGPEAEGAAGRTTFARVMQPVGEGRIERWGFVTRLLGDLDPVGRMARLLVAIRDPLGLRSSTQADQGVNLPLLLGAYVEVQLRGVALEGLIEVPRLALRDGDNVYVATADSKLDIRKVDVVRRRPDSVLVSAGLKRDERVIVSAMPAAVQGMDLRVRGDERAGSERASIEGEATHE